MEVFDVKCGGMIERAEKREYDGRTAIRVILPGRGNLSNQIFKSERGWQYSSDDFDNPDYFFRVWLKEDGTLEWANDMSKGIKSSGEVFDPKRQNAGLLNDVATKLYEVSRQIEEHEKRNIPALKVMDLRRYYLTTTLRLLGYVNGVDSIGDEINDTDGYLGLNRVAEQLKDYDNIAPLVHCIGYESRGPGYGDEEMVVYTIPDDMTREDFIERARPLKEHIEANLKFMKKQEEGVFGRKLIITEDEQPMQLIHNDIMSTNVSPEDWETYSKAVQKIAHLLLELNADLLTPEQRQRFNIADMTSLEGIELEDIVSSVIDSREFCKGCNIENKFACERSSNLVKELEEMLLYVEGDEQIKLEEIISTEKIGIEERTNAIDNYEKYFSEDGAR